MWNHKYFLLSPLPLCRDREIQHDQFFVWFFGHALQSNQNSIMTRPLGIQLSARCWAAPITSCYKTIVWCGELSHVSRNFQYSRISGLKLIATWLHSTAQSLYRTHALTPIHTQFFLHPLHVVLFNRTAVIHSSSLNIDTFAQARFPLFPKSVTLVTEGPPILMRNEEEQIL